MDIIDGRWKEAELYIQTDNKIWCLYHIYIIKRRNYKIEKMILDNNIVQCVYHYARDIIKGRWFEAEENCY